MEPKRLTVLAIEDEPSDAALLERHLERIPEYEVELTVCPDAQGGLDRLSQGEIDVVLLDYYLGAETGLTVLKAIQQLRAGVPVVFMTGRGDEEVAVQAMQAGAADYLPKVSLSTASLQRAISNAVEKSRLQSLVAGHRRRLEEMNADLNQRNLALQEFHHAMSHELKSPLTGVQGFLQVMLQGAAGELSDDQREYLGMSLESCREMNRCIDDLLDATRLETGKLTIERETVSLEPLLQRAVRTMEHVAREKELELVLELEDDLPEVCLDAARIGQVVRNLITNALKFTEPGGSVRVTAELIASDEPSVRVAVHDTGRGIAPADQKRIFERLYQAQDDDTKCGGLGLGLAICTELLALHEARLSVESEPGVGSTFSFMLPAHVPAEIHGSHLRMTS